MICPQCRCEYRAGATQCSDCGVPLVAALDPGTLAPTPEGGIVSVWAGNDPRKFAAVKESLEKAGISCINPDSTRYFILPSMRPKMEIAVSSLDVERSEKVLAELGERNDVEELTPEEIESLALPESDIADDYEAATPPSEFPEDWDDQQPVTEVWGGEDEDFANTLIICLRENGIPSHKLAEAGHWHLVVRPEQEARAKEIVAEVVEARPPE